MKKAKHKKHAEPVPPIVHYTEGDGITIRHRVRIPDRVEYLDELKRLHGIDRPRARNSVDHALRDHIEWAKKILSGAGLPTEAMRDGKFWGILGFVESKGYKRFSAPEWYAADLLESSDRIAIWFSRGDPGEMKTASFEAVHAGYKAREIDDKFRSGIEPDALLGRKDRVVRRRGGEATGKRTAAAAQERNKPILDMNEKLLPKHPAERERAAIIARKLKRSESTIRSILRSK